MAKVGGNGSAEKVSPKFEILCSRARLPPSVGLFSGGSPLNHPFGVIILKIIFLNFCSRFIHFLLKPLRQPMIVCEILTSILFGRSVLGQEIGLYRDDAAYAIMNFGMLGLMFFLFISGVQIDVSVIKNAGRENTYTALAGVFVPMISMMIVAVFFKLPLVEGFSRVDLILSVASSIAITSYPVIHLVLRELKLLSSEMGRKAITIAVIGDVIGTALFLVIEAVVNAKGDYKECVLRSLSSIGLGAFLLICVRRVLFWIIDKTPEGKPVDQLYVVLTLLSALVMGFITDMLGVNNASGSLCLGLLIPSGPPLGATIVERSWSIIMDIFMPLTFMLIGSAVSTSAMAACGWMQLLPFLAMIITGYITKAAVTFLVSCHFGVQWKDSLTLTLIMSLRGQAELLVYLHWLHKMSIGVPIFTVFVFVLTFVTGISTYFLTDLYDPTMPYLVNTRRTIQHTRPGAELLVVVCVPGEESVPALIDLIEISNPSPRSSLMIYAIHLMELVGQVIPLLINHEEQPDGTISLQDEHTEKIYNALKSYEAKDEYVKFHLITAMTPKRTMHQDICYLALIKNAALIVIPLKKDEIEQRFRSKLHGDGQGMQSVNEKVITHSPCSVAIFVSQENDQKPGTRQSFSQLKQRFVLLFLGGADAREALAYADRMVTNPIVDLKVVRFIPSYDGWDKIERKLDDGMLIWFLERNESNERVLYTEVLSNNGDETIAAIQELAEDKTDVWIVGRRQGINPVLLTGLLEWGNEQSTPELGIIGEFLTSDDFGSKASVLVFHQQILRGQHPGSS